MSRIKEFLVYPIIVGIIVALVAFLLPLIKERKKEIQYHIEEPISYLEPEKIGNLNIQINGEESKQLNAYIVSLKNTGNIPVKDLEALFIFTKPTNNFKIYSDYHKTSPKYQFGEIYNLETDSNSRKFKYKLFNPNDEATLTILVNETATLEVYSKQENLTFQKKEKEGKYDKWKYIIQIMFVIVGVLSSVLTKMLEHSDWLKNILKKLR